MNTDLEIFRTGTHTDMNGVKITVSNDDLVAMAAAYDPTLHEAPMVLGHPEHNDPAMGWIKSLKVNDGVLLAETDQVNPDFAEAVNNGLFKKISSSLYRPGAASNPMGDVYGLRHVGFLGAQVPAIKGLKSVSFADEDADAMCFTMEFSEREQGWAFNSISRLFRGMRDWFIENHGMETADQLIPDYSITNLQDISNDLTKETGPEFAEPTPTSETKEPEMDAEEIKAKEAEIAQREADLKAKEDQTAARESEFAEKQKQHLETENASFLEGLVTDGRLATGKKAEVLAFMNQIDNSETVSFGEGDDKTPLAFFKELMSSAKPIVDFGEHTGDDADEDTANTVSFSSPSGFQVNSEGLELDRKAQDYMKSNPGTEYIDAVQVVSTGG